MLKKTVGVACTITICNRQATYSQAPCILWESLDILASWKELCNLMLCYVL